MDATDRRDDDATRGRRSTTRGSSTTRAASGSSRMRAGASRATGPAARARRDSRRSPIVGRSRPTASRAMAPASRCRCRSSLLRADRRRPGDGSAGRRDGVPAAWARPHVVRRAPRRGRVCRCRSADRRPGDPCRSSASALGCGGGGVAPGRRAGDRRSAGRARAIGRSSVASSSPDAASSRPRGPPVARIAGLSIPSASCADGRLQGPRRRARASPTCTRTCVRELDVALRGLPPAVRHEHDARLAARPAVPVDRPQRRDQHGPRQPRAGPRADARPRRGRRSRPSCSTPARCCSPDGSDSLSLDEGLELLTTTGWDLAPALLAAIPEAVGLRRAPHPHVATLRRRTAGMLAPWDGPAAIVFADGRRVGALVDRNGLRPAAFAVTSDRLVAVASEAGAVPFEATRDRSGGAGSGPGEMLLVEPARRAILEDTDAKAHVLRHLPIHDAPRPLHEDSAEAAAAVIEGRGPLDHTAALPRRARRREGTARYQDDGARGARAAVEHGRRHAHGRPRSSGPAGGRPPPPGLRAGDQPGHRPRAGAGRHGPSSRARAPTGAAGRPASRATHAAARAPDRRGPRRSSRGGARRRAPGARAGRDVAGRRRRRGARASPRAPGGRGRRRERGGHRDPARSAMRRHRPIVCPCRRSWRSGPSTPR